MVTDTTAQREPRGTLAQRATLVRQETQGTTELDTEVHQELQGVRATQERLVVQATLVTPEPTAHPMLAIAG
jgi:hypothetical protein